MTLQTLVTYFCLSVYIFLFTQASEKSQSKTEIDSMVTDILRVFVDAFPHIAAHRKIPLFTRLVDTVGSKNHLWTMLALLFELHVTKTAADVPEWHDKVGFISYRIDVTKFV